MEPKSLNESRRRRVIKELDGRYVVPETIDPIRVLMVRQVPDGAGTNWHWVYVTLCEEVDPDE